MKRNIFIGIAAIILMATCVGCKSNDNENCEKGTVYDYCDACGKTVCVVRDGQRTDECSHQG